MSSMEQSCFYIDIGNTCIDFLWEDGRHQKIALTDSSSFQKTMEDIKKESPSAKLFVSSVNKEASEALQAKCHSLDLSYRFLGKEDMRGFAEGHGLVVPNIEILGSDLFCDLVAEDAPTGLFVLDLGTVSKILYLDAEGYFHGASLLPGLALIPHSLAEGTSLLEETSLRKSAGYLSLNTDECIASGAIHGTVGSLLYLLRKAEEEFRAEKARIVLTGGNAIYVKDELIKEANPLLIEERPDWTLLGLKRIFTYLLK